MDAHLRRAREKIRRASDRADGEVQQNLLSLDEGLEELTEGGKTEGTGEPADEAERFKHIEEKLRGLIDETDDETKTVLRDARDELDAYRQRDLA
ncbi:DUF7553 family protein [Haladaptatus pallidirubidus]|uniref:Uncharacterized protein n=1 Tax=Haladaptatus pallidirubidus TaxID=1008152 RepID=A0AAV3UB38_9EURY|nr:hypothetical protein [Haladaptatus pallidirubidus]